MGRGMSRLVICGLGLVACRAAGDGVEDRGQAKVAEAAKGAEAAEARSDAAQPVEADRPEAESAPAGEAEAAKPDAPVEVGPKPVPSFRLVAKLSPDNPSEPYEIPALRIFASVDGSVFVAGGPLVLRVTDEGELPAPTPAAMGGVHPLTEEMSENQLYGYFGWRVAYLGGRWPDGLFMTTSWGSGFRLSMDPFEQHRWRDDRWQFIETLSGKLAYHIARAAPWVDGQLLGLRSYSVYLPDADEETYDELYDAAAPLVAKARKLVVLRGEGKAPAGLSKQSIVDFDALPDGTIVALVGGAKALKYTLEGDAITDQTLPGEDARYDRVELVDARHGWAWSSAAPAVLAAYDGETWGQDQAPACGEVGLASFALGPGGRQWAACGAPISGDGMEPGGGVWSRLAGEPWVTVALPAGAQIRQIIARGPDDVWLAGDRGVYHSKAPREVVTMPSLERMWLDSLAYRDPVSAEGECKWYTAVLAGSPEGEHDEALAAVRGALAGIELDGGELGVGVFRGKKQLVFSYPGTDRSKRATKALRGQLGEQLEDIYCFFPEDFEATASVTED
ncbi:hypothetical protein G6O69_25090 [Pseudenhygromyxa sp. WMMC2535]|uniref:hypothetical protein n=1 Tax=Pseudenhygromyxa sp. WMMC2535 TaxID=2712867 RepID=UPI00155221DB|nr:hypothetical protein [Pseudenhygromyxa sp. WMMC2535]NVB41140.1 hypothetical protein [Pseudenhygromyxa sp. WMMC2535]